MLDALQRFILRHDDNHDAVRLLPLKAAKLEIVKESYNSIIFIPSISE